MSSGKNSWEQQVCWSIGESKSFDTSSWSQGYSDQSGSQWALIRAALDRKTCVALSRMDELQLETFVGQLEIQ